MISYPILLALSMLGLASALPSPISKGTSLTPRCGVKMVPESFFLLNEDEPDAYIPINNGLFQVSQAAGSNGATNRTYTMIHFAPTPYGTTGCELVWYLDPTLQFIEQVGPAQIDVQQTTGYIPPFRPTWNNIIAANPPTVSGVQGTVNAYAGADAVINTFACSNGPPAGMVGGGYGLTFVFKLAGWVEQMGVTAAEEFYMGMEMETFTDAYLQYGC